MEILEAQAVLSPALLDKNNPHRMRIISLVAGLPAGRQGLEDSSH